MTVKDLRELLESLDQDTEIKVRMNSDGEAADDTAIEDIETADFQSHYYLLLEE